MAFDDQDIPCKPMCNPSPLPSSLLFLKHVLALFVDSVRVGVRVMLLMIVHCIMKNYVQLVMG